MSENLYYGGEEPPLSREDEPQFHGAIEDSPMKTHQWRQHFVQFLKWWCKCPSKATTNVNASNEEVEETINVVATELEKIGYIRYLFSVIAALLLSLIAVYVFFVIRDVVNSQISKEKWKKSAQQHIHHHAPVAPNTGSLEGIDPTQSSSMSTDGGFKNDQLYDSRSVLTAVDGSF